MLFPLAACLAAFAMAQEPTPDILSRVAEEAELLAQKVPNALAQETLEQRTLRMLWPPPTGNKDDQASELRLARTIVSEYTVAPLKDSESKELVEFRQVISVDGRAVQSAESARHALSLGVLSAGESARKRMLEVFAKHGLQDVATDYALILLAFTNLGQKSLKILPSGEDRVGPDEALVFAWAQSTPGGGQLSFHGNQSARLPLTGKLWARKSDGVPLRVWVWAVQTVTGHSIRDEATIDYVMSTHGFVMPVSVLHHHLVDGQLRTENLYRYDPFKLFSADIQIQFPEPDAQPPEQPAHPPK
jgi:hypothetical protein